MSTGVVPDKMVESVREFLDEVALLLPKTKDLPTRVEMSDLERFQFDETIVRVRYGEPWSIQASANFDNKTGQRTEDPIRLIER